MNDLGVQDIHQAIRRELTRRRQPGEFPKSGPSGDSPPPPARAGSRPGLYQMARWLYGVFKAPSRIRDLLLLLKLSDQKIAALESRLRRLEQEDRSTGAPLPGGNGTSFRDSETFQG